MHAPTHCCAPPASTYPLASSLVVVYYYVVVAHIRKQCLVVASLERRVERGEQGFPALLLLTASQLQPLVDLEYV